MLLLLSSWISPILTCCKKLLCSLNLSEVTLRVGYCLVQKQLYFNFHPSLPLIPLFIPLTSTCIKNVYLRHKTGHTRPTTEPRHRSWVVLGIIWNTIPEFQNRYPHNIFFRYLTNINALTHFYQNIISLHKVQVWPEIQCQISVLFYLWCYRHILVSTKNVLTTLGAM